MEEEAVQAETYRAMHDIAVNNLGYESILEALEACPAATYPQKGEHPDALALLELTQLYNHHDTDEPQFTRWQMVTAIAHGRRLGADAQARSVGRERAEYILRQFGDGLPWQRGRGRDTWGAAIEAMLAFAALEAARHRQQAVAEMRDALKVGERFLDKCFSAWSCGEPAHRVKDMLDAADIFRATLDALERPLGGEG